MTIVRQGGFRSRPRVRFLRALWSLLRSVPIEIRYELPRTLRSSVDWRWRTDRMDSCPHLPSMRSSSWMNPGWIDCDQSLDGCGMNLKTPNGWRVPVEGGV